MKELESKCGKTGYFPYICCVYLLPYCNDVCYRFRYTLMYIWYLYTYYMKNRVSMDINELKYDYDTYFICHPDDLVHVGILCKTQEKV